MVWYVCMKVVYIYFVHMYKEKFCMYVCMYRETTCASKPPEQI